MGLDKETIEAIDNYSDKIEEKKDFVDAVRSFPGMYLGHRGNKGFQTMIREIYQNSVDQLIMKESPCDHIWVSYNEKTNEVIVEDNGLGIPYDKMVKLFTKEHVSKNYTKRKGEFSSGLHGVGAKCVNAASTSFIVESYKYDGTGMRLEMVEGYPKSDPKPIKNKDKKQGTKITFIPSTEVMGDLSLPWESIYSLIKKILSLTPIGSIVDLHVVDHTGKIHDEHIINKDGIITDLISRVKNPIIKPIILNGSDGIRSMNLAFCYDSGGDEGPESQESVVAFSNFCPTVSGTHIDGVLEGICRWFVTYMNNIYLLNQKSKEKIKVNNADIKNGLNVFISAAHLEPVFTGQAKETLGNEDFVAWGKQFVMNGLDEWSKMNPQDLQKLARFFKDMAELRMKADASKAKIATKYKANVLSGLPDKYAKPLGKKNLELLIVEGDSAGGQAKNARCKDNQGIFPIRGKMPNAFQKSRKEFLENAEVQAIIHILLGKEYTKNFDPYKDCKYDKIIFLADADVDRQYCPKMLFA